VTAVSEAQPSGFVEAIANPALRRLLTGFAALNLSEWSFVTALSIDAYRVAGTLAVGFVGFRFVPGALSSAVLAPLVESRRQALPYIAAARFALLAIAACAVLIGAPLAVALVLVALDAVVAAAYRPTQSRILPGLARTPAELTAAAAGISIVKTVAQAGGALAGGVAVGFASPGATMAGATAVMSVAVVTTHGLGRAVQPAGPAWATLKAGISAIPTVLRQREAAPLVFASSLRTFSRGMWTALLVVVALHVFSLGSSGVGIFNGAAGVGAVLAIAITASLIGRAHLGGACALSFVCAGLAVSIVGVSHVGAVAIVVICIWGAAMAIADATSLSLLHRLLNAATISRTVGVMESLKLGAEGLGALLAPALVAVFGVRTALIVAGLPLPLTILLSSTNLRRADHVAAGRSKVVASLHKVHALRSLDMASLEDVAARATKLVVPAGADVIRQGDPGDAYYVIESGEAELLVDGYRIGELGAGSAFGERALLRNTPRFATVRAQSAITMYAIDRAGFLSAITGRPVEEFEGREAVELAVEPKSGTLAEILGGLAMFAAADRGTLEELAGQATVEHWQPGTTVIPREIPRRSCTSSCRDARGRRSPGRP
jgi:hypothetical protein